MPSHPQTSTTSQTIPPITPIDSLPIVEHGNSPTAIILAVAMLIVMLIGSMASLMRVLLLVVIHQSKTLPNSTSSAAPQHCPPDNSEG